MPLPSFGRWTASERTTVLPRRAFKCCSRFVSSFRILVSTIQSGVLARSVDSSSILLYLDVFVEEAAMKVVDVLRPAVESRLCEIKASSDAG